MQQILIVACQSHKQDKLKRGDKHFSEENRIKLDHDKEINMTFG